MKKFLTFMLTAMLLTVVVSMMVLTFNTAAAEENTNSTNVIFVSDDYSMGDGSGRDAANPLRPVEVDDELINEKIVTDEPGKETSGKYYLRTALYQAAEKLVETGGTIVICGPVNIDRSNSLGSSPYYKDFELPTSAYELTITSKYNGVDYTKADTGGAYLGISAPAYLLMGSPSVFEYVTIKTAGAKRAICACGNRIEMGDGVKCGFLDPTTADNGANYISIAGGNRHGNLTADSNVIIKSGTYGYIAGSTWGVDTFAYVQKGDINIDILGGIIRSSVCGTSQNTAYISVYGDVNINIGGTAHIGGSIYASNKSKFANSYAKVHIKLSGGSYYYDANNKVVIKECDASYSPSADAKVYDAKAYVLEIEDYSKIKGYSGPTDAQVQERILSSEGYKIMYPAGDIKAARVMSNPENYVLFGDSPTVKGTELEVDYNVKGTTVTQTFKYNDIPEAFSVNCDASSVGTATAEYYFDGFKYQTVEIDVVAVPKVTISGVQIRTNTAEQQMYGWGKYTLGYFPDMTIKECGVLAIPTDMLTDGALFDHNSSYGMYDAKADKWSQDDTYRSFGALVFGDEAIRENNYNRNYSLRAYIKFEYAGKEYYRYSGVIERNFYDVAMAAISGNIESDETKNWLQENVVDVVDGYDPTYPYNPEGAEAARAKVVDYMRKMSDIEWTPEETFVLYCEGTYNQYSYAYYTTEMYAIFYEGVTYHGIPYGNSTMGQYESFLDKVALTDIKPLVDANNVPIKKGDLNLKKIIKNVNGKDIIDPQYHFTNNLTPEQKAAGLENAKKFPGSDCLIAVMYAWNTVLNNNSENKDLKLIDDMLTLKYGTVKVGNYEMDMQYIVNGRNNTKAITKAIDDQTMAKAYAALQPGDITVHSTQEFDEDTQKYTDNGRHVRIVTSVEVKYTLDISAGFKKVIDLDRSKVNFIHQAGGAASVYIFDENDQSLCVTEKTFRQLKDQGNLPMSIPELMTGNVDKPKAIALGMNLAEDLPHGELSGTIKANKQMINVRVVFTDENGNEVFEKKELLSTTYGTIRLAETNLAKIDLSGMKLTSGEKYSFDLYTCISGMDGEEIQLVDGYEFIAS
ncbi:MAG: hypothetical protein IKU48_01085 [Clostridia bacterium]|nr:hypothetical protein [Clostridia bacterium]